ncbi:hypothetical protein Lesp02_18600 [Lentzea sp. NBRC 105346]|uniref:hypothetical protein n=1 Tax=Lentzea sp. NBRC 105346 TaxID=3032205 RepID=UPI0024A534DC|nr:hypothetical protein [Lentzea sp. NBRC 105346]GLZ29670.1 hypothetical protein Lesp02_18600 [Lentzea sp. NBRC 105346]
MNRRTRSTIALALVCGASACAGPRTASEEAVDNASTAVRARAAQMREDVEYLWREQGEGDVVPIVQNSMAQNYIWLIDHRQEGGATVVDVAVHDVGSGDGFLLPDRQTVVVRLCVRLDVRKGAPVVMTDAPCPSTLDNSVRGLGTVKATVTLT